MAAHNRPYSTLHSPDEPAGAASQYSLHTPVESVAPSSFRGAAAPSEAGSSSTGYIHPSSHASSQHQQHQHQHQQYPHQQPQGPAYYPPPPTQPVTPNTYYVAQYAQASPLPQPAPLPSPQFASTPPMPGAPAPYGSPPGSPGFPPPPQAGEQYAMQTAPVHASPPPQDFRAHNRTPTPPHPGYLGHPTPTGTPVQHSTPVFAAPTPPPPLPAHDAAAARPPVPPEPIHTPGYPGSDSTGTSPATPKTPVYTPHATAGPNGGGAHAPGQIAHPNQQHGLEDYHHGLCDCFSDVGTCCTGYWCPCILYSRTQHRLKTVPNSNLNGFQSLNGDCALWCVTGPFSWILTTLQRSRIRENYRLQGSIVDDCCKAYCCVMCTLVQDEREVRDREDERRRFAGPGSGVVGSEGYRRHTGMVYG